MTVVLERAMFSSAPLHQFALIEYMLPAVSYGLQTQRTEPNRPTELTHIHFSFRNPSAHGN